MKFSQPGGDKSKLLNNSHIKILKDKKKIDNYITFTDSGWFRIVGYKNKQPTLYLHCDDSDEFDKMMDTKVFFRKWFVDKFNE